jgi:N-acetyl-beta-hexosaminidase
MPLVAAIACQSLHRQRQRDWRYCNEKISEKTPLLLPLRLSPWFLNSNVLEVHWLLKSHVQIRTI